MSELLMTRRFRQGATILCVGLVLPFIWFVTPGQIGSGSGALVALLAFSLCLMVFGSIVMAVHRGARLTTSGRRALVAVLGLALAANVSLLIVLGPSWPSILVHLFWGYITISQLVVVMRRGWREPAAEQG